jgi:alkanesulfonate monooxygenase SsuD/methylene tetrahydromethanopterin reductase-like flavin-dependent oxidoreductase (luciferase family)
MHVGMSTFFQNLTGTHTDAEVYGHELSMADLAEPLGFDGVWAPEHHFDDYTMCPNVVQFLTWVAARTSRVRLGSMVVVLPWHDPMWIAEQFSVLDHVSGGRGILGIGRGLGRIEFDGYRINMAESRQRFTEYAAAIIKGFDTGVMESDGSFYTQPRTPIRPSPLRSLKGRVYASAASPESAPVMARLGIGIMIIAQKPWASAIAELDTYRGVYREVNHSEPPKPLLATFTAVHESEDMAREMYERYIVGYCQSALEHYEFANAHLATIPGYEYYGKLADNIVKHGSDRFVRFLADLQVWGTPTQVTEHIIENIRRIDGAGVICVFSFGGMPHDLAKANIRLFADKVLPTLRAYDVGATVGGALHAAA